MPTINDSITLGSYQFTFNPSSYSVSPIPMKSSKRSLNGTLQTTYVVDINSKTIIKNEITLSGITSDQLDSILTEFKKATNLTFIDIYNNTLTVQFSDFSYSIESDKVNYPSYDITLTEV